MMSRGNLSCFENFARAIRKLSYSSHPWVRWEAISKDCLRIYTYQIHNKIAALCLFPRKGSSTSLTYNVYSFSEILSRLLNFTLNLIDLIYIYKINSI